MAKWKTEREKKERTSDDGKIIQYNPQSHIKCREQCTHLTKLVLEKLHQLPIFAFADTARTEKPCNTRKKQQISDTLRK